MVRYFPPSAKRAVTTLGVYRWRSLWPAFSRAFSAQNHLLRIIEPRAIDESMSPGFGCVCWLTFVL